MHVVIAMSNIVGHPDFFRTIVSSLSWTETTRGLLENEKVQDRLHLCALLFHTNLRKMMRCIQVEGIFGDVDVHLHNTEIKKRSLRHAHCMIFLHKESKEKLNDSGYVDKVIRAEIHAKSDQEL